MSRTSTSTERLYASLRENFQWFQGDIYFRQWFQNDIYFRLLLILSQIGVRQELLHATINEIFGVIRTTASEHHAVTIIADILRHWSKVNQGRLEERAMYFANLASPYAEEGTLLDYGCGDGEVSFQLVRSRKVSRASDLFLYDATAYLTDRVRRCGAGFSTDWKEVSKRGPFDTALAFMVFHHTEDPEAAIDQLLSVVTRRVIVVESVINGLNQLVVQGFVDWFYNRCLHPEAAVPVPGNFRSAGTWENDFTKRGWRALHSQDLGIDQLIVPEHHYLFVFERK